MARRTKDWDKTLSEEMKNVEFAREFILALLEEGDTLQEALSKTIRAYGVKEFAQVSGLSDSNIVRSISPDHNPTEKTLSALLKPFGLRLSAQVDVVA